MQVVNNRRRRSSSRGYSYREELNATISVFGMAHPLRLLRKQTSCVFFCTLICDNFMCCSCSCTKYVHLYTYSKICGSEMFYLFHKHKRIVDITYTYKWQCEFFLSYFFFFFSTQYHNYCERNNEIWVRHAHDNLATTKIIKLILQKKATRKNK